MTTHSSTNASANTQSPHSYNRPIKSDDNEEDDPFDAMLNRTGCAQLHYNVQDCMAEHRDWRICQKQVHQFRDCMKEYEKNKSSKS